MGAVILTEGQQITIEVTPVVDIQPGDRIVPNEWVPWAYAEVIDVSHSPSGSLIDIVLDVRNIDPITKQRGDSVAKVVTHP